MHESAGLAVRIGAIGLLFSLPVPWFGHSFGPISINYSLWDLSNAATAGLIVFALLVLVQLNIGPSLTGLMWTIAGAGLAAYLCYRLFTPPMTVSSELLDSLNLNPKPRPGIFLAIAGAGTIAYGGWLQMRIEASRETGTSPRESAMSMTTPAPSARYVAPQPSDPFAKTPGPGRPPAQSPAVPPDPFAPPPPPPPGRAAPPPAA